MSWIHRSVWGMVRAGKDLLLADCITFLKSPSFSIFIAPISSISVMNDIFLNKQDNSSTFAIVLFYSTFVVASKWEKSGNSIHSYMLLYSIYVNNTQLCTQFPDFSCLETAKKENKTKQLERWRNYSVCLTRVLTSHFVSGFIGTGYLLFGRNYLVIFILLLLLLPNGRNQEMVYTTEYY